nr:MAG TPA: hypothetical protein [Caudoviricetes sp.]
MWQITTHIVPSGPGKIKSRAFLCPILRGMV